MTRSQYFQAFWSHSRSIAELSESLIAADEEALLTKTAVGNSAGTSYSLHLSTAAANSGLASGTLVQVRL